MIASENEFYMDFMKNPDDESKILKLVSLIEEIQKDVILEENNSEKILFQELMKNIHFFWEFIENR